MSGVRSDESLSARPLPETSPALLRAEDSTRLLDPMLRLLVSARRPGRNGCLEAASASLRRLAHATGAELSLLCECPVGGSGLKITRATVESDSLAGASAGSLEQSLLSLSQSDLGRQPDDFRHLLLKIAGLKFSTVELTSFADAVAPGLLVVAGTPRIRRETEIDPALLVPALRNIGSALEFLLERSRDRSAARDDTIAKSYFMARLTRSEFRRIGEEDELDAVLLKRLGEERIADLKIVPLELTDEGVIVALADPLNFKLIEEFEIAVGHRVVGKVVAPACDIERVALKLREISYDDDLRLSIADAYDGLEDYMEESKDGLVTEHSAPIVKLANGLIEKAFLAGASDIHIEPGETEITLRYRVDGICQVIDQFPKRALAPLVNRIKIMANMDISEHRLPQDGRIVFKQFGPEVDVDLRVSVVPLTFGESLVMRLISKTGVTLPLSALGFSEQGLKVYETWLRRPYGMILHAGPTGSGKSMSLYAALNVVSTPRIKVLTAEDPVEYTLPGINQLEIRSEVGLTFARALRAFLRQDPDVILVGEIRDAESAEIATTASLTGHLLLTTLHANSAAAAIPRLAEIGIDPYMISCSLLGVCAQRLLRRLCTCKVSAAPRKNEREILLEAGLEVPEMLYRPGTCERCDHTGFKGRIGVYELLSCEGKVQELIAKGAGMIELERAAEETGFRTMYVEALARAAEGATALAESLRVTGEG